MSYGCIVRSCREMRFEIAAAMEQLTNSARELGSRAQSAREAHWPLVPRHLRDSQISGSNPIESHQKMPFAMRWDLMLSHRAKIASWRGGRTQSDRDGTSVARSDGKGKRAGEESR